MKRLCFALVLAAFLAPAMPAVAEEVSHDRAKELCRDGKVICLGRILKRAMRACRGRVLDVELHKRQGGGPRWVYVVSMLTVHGHGVRIVINARTADIVRIKPPGRCAVDTPRGDN